MKASAVVLILLLPTLLLAQGTRPRIGLALSGGGAKGIAHVGLLKAIDSAGINIDYVAGTSMGAIVGGLYASGYSGNEIAQYASQMDWNSILSNKPRYQELILPKKETSEQFLEIPWVNNKLHFGKGILESNELWLWLGYHFFPYIAHTDFSKMPIPFRCVATRLENGEVVILDKGNLVKSIRASMAIPSVFTPVTIDDNLLIDGGLVMNFPVSEVRNMGADFVIGSSVADGQQQSNNLDNPFQIISQIAFYGEQRDYKEQVANSNIFVDYPMGKYYAGSFSSADEILDMGIKRGHDIYPILKKLKDSLDAIYGVEEHKKLRPEKVEKVKVAHFTASGLDYHEYSFFMKQLKFKVNEEYTPAEISERIRKSFASGIFKKIDYTFEQNADTTVDIHLDFEKDHRTYLKAGLAYNTETGLGIKLGASWNGLLGPFSNSSVAVSIGENPQLLAKNTYYFDKARSFYLENSFSTGLNEMGLYNSNLNKIGIYNQTHMRLEANIYKLLNKDFAYGIGTRYEYLKYNPEIQTSAEARGKTNFLNSYFTAKYNTLDAAYNPRKGNIVNFELGVHYAQNPKFSYFDGTENKEFSDAQVKNYGTLRYYSAHYLPLYKHTGFFKLNAGVHFGNKLPYLNSFLVGGNNFVFRNQVLFSGFRLNAVSSSSVLTGQLGYRYHFTPKLSLAAASSMLVYDFVSTNYHLETQKTKTVLGFDLTAGYRSVIGPIEISVMYNSINDRLTTTFNVGYSLTFSK